MLKDTPQSTFTDTQRKGPKLAGQKCVQKKRVTKHGIKAFGAAVFDK